MKVSRALIKGFFNKEEGPVRIIYNSTYRLLFHIAFSYLHQKEDTEDIVSETYKRMFETNCTLVNPNNFTSYMAMVCKNLSLDFLKRKKTIDQEYDETLDGKNDYYQSDLLNKLKEVISEEEFNVFIYHAYYDLSFKEISKLLDKTESRCRGIYFEAKKKIKNKKELFL